MRYHLNSPTPPDRAPGASLCLGHLGGCLLVGEDSLAGLELAVARRWRQPDAGALGRRRVEKSVENIVDESASAAS